MYIENLIRYIKKSNPNLRYLQFYLRVLRPKHANRIANIVGSDQTFSGQDVPCLRKPVWPYT